MFDALLVVNEKSGSGKKNISKIKYIKEYLNKNNYNLTIFETKTLDDVYLYLTNNKLPDVVLLMGGDGTINHFINDLMTIKNEKNLTRESIPKIFIISTGTSNDISKILTLSKNVKQSLKLIVNNSYEYVDINKVNNKYFFFCSAYGFLTDISFTTPQKLKNKYGYLAYLYNGLKSLKNFNNFNLKINWEQGEISIPESFLVLVLSGNEFGSLRLSNYDKSTKLNDGKIELRVFSKYKKQRIGKMLSFVARSGKIAKNEFHLQTNFFKISLIGEPEMRWNIDGEAGPLAQQVTYEVINEALPFFVGKKARQKLF